jgi:hypothetical protein
MTDGCWDWVIKSHWLDSDNKSFFSKIRGWKFVSKQAKHALKNGFWLSPLPHTIRNFGAWKYAGHKIKINFDLLEGVGIISIAYTHIAGDFEDQLKQSTHSKIFKFNNIIKSETAQLLSDCDKFR